MLRQLLLIICPVFLFLQSNQASAQKIDSVLGIYSDRFQQEKMYLHLDKSLYNKGETIWFKAYVLAGTDLSDYSKTLYVDWYDAKGKLLKHILAPMFESSAKGQFEIPAGYTEPYLHVRAYTKWMLNFDSAFLYNKDIPVSQAKPVKVVEVSPVSPVTTLHFFPEGGDLVTGLASRVAFMAVNSGGLPVNVSGSVKTGAGIWVDSFTTVHDGMGSFVIEPQAGETYTATWTDESGKVYNTPLPLCKNTGAILQAQPLASKTVVAIKRPAVVNENLKMLNLVAHMNQQVIYRSKVDLSIKTGTVAEIPTSLLPSGVLQLTLFDGNWSPLAERVVFINNHQYQFHPEISVPVKGLEKRGKNVMEIEVPDSTLSNLSVAVTDGGLSVDSSNTIISQLLLCGDIKGYIHHPAYYFSGEDDSIAEHLDLVMLTHGWRRFKWEEVAAGNLPVIPYARDSDFMQIKGKAFGSSKMRSDQEIFLILQAKDSSKQTLILPVNADGSFIQKGVVFFDSLKVYYRLLGDKRLTSNRTELVFQTGLLSRPKNLVDDTSPYLWQVDTAGLSRARYFAAEQARMEQLAKSTTLEEVVVKTNVKRPVDILDQKYATGMFSGGMDDYQFDILHDIRAQSSMDVLHYLQGMVAGLQLQMSHGQWVLTWRNAHPQLYLDQIPVTDVNRISNMPMSDIAYVKVFRPPFFGAAGGGAGGAIAVYSRRGGDIQNAPGEGLDYKLLEGYTLYKEFYSPDYSQPTGDFLPDVRTTLYWNPYVLTDASTHKVKLEFYNNDISKKLRIVLEGINADGKLARVEKMIE